MGWGREIQRPRLRTLRYRRRVATTRPGPRTVRVKGGRGLNDVQLRKRRPVQRTTQQTPPRTGTEGMEEEEEA